MRNWSFALALGAMVCVGSGAYADNNSADNSTEPNIQRSCALVAKDIYSNNSPGIKKDTKSMLKAWEFLDLYRVWSRKTPLRAGLLPQNTKLQMAESVFTWCAQHQNKDLFDAAEDIYEQEMAQLKAEKQLHADNNSAENSIDPNMQRSCVLVDIDLRSHNEASLKKDTKTIVRSWELRDLYRIWSRKTPLTTGLLSQSTMIQMAKSIFVWCAQHPNKDLFDAADDIYEQEIVKLKAEKKLPADNNSAENSIDPNMQRSCALVAQDIRSNNVDALKRDAVTIGRDWVVIGSHPKPINGGLLTPEGFISRNALGQMLKSTFAWCVQHPKKDLFDATADIYDQEMAKLKAEKSSH